MGCGSRVGEAEVVPSWCCSRTALSEDSCEVGPAQETGRSGLARAQAEDQTSKRVPYAARMSPVVGIAVTVLLLQIMACDVPSKAAVCFSLRPASSR